MSCFVVKRLLLLYDVSEVNGASVVWRLELLACDVNEIYVVMLVTTVCCYDNRTIF